MQSLPNNKVVFNHVAECFDEALDVMIGISTPEDAEEAGELFKKIQTMVTWLSDDPEGVDLLMVSGLAHALDRFADAVKRLSAKLQPTIH